MKKYRLYLFDFDYTLVDSSEGIVGCFNLAMEKMGLPKADPEEVRQTIGMPMLEAIKKITHDDDDDFAWKFLYVYKDFADLHMTNGTHFFKNTVSVLNELKARGAKLGIISTKTRHRIQDKFNRENIPDLIDHIIGSEDVKTHKPDPEGILKGLEYFAITAEDVLYVGDSCYDAGAAQNAGLDFVGVTTGTTDADTLAKYPHIAIVDDLTGIL